MSGVCDWEHMWELQSYLSFAVSGFLGFSSYRLECHTLGNYTSQRGNVHLTRNTWGLLFRQLLSKHFF